MFEHSVKVPRLYKTAAKLAKQVKENNASLKQVVFEDKHVNKKAVYALILETLQHESQLDFLFRKSQILVKEQRLDDWLTRILVTELLWGKKRLPGDSKPVKTILAYQQIFMAHLDNVHENDRKAVVKTVNKPRYARVNTLSLTVNEAIEGFRDEGWTFVRHTDGKDYNGFLEKVANLQPEEFMVDLHIKELLIFPPNTPFYKHNAYKNGSIFLQDKASCIPVAILGPRPGSTVLDMCAAPGMKTSQIAALMNNEGTVYAVERDINRSKTLEQLIETAGASCVQIINKDVLKVSAKECPEVEFILVDPSCSGSGITDRIELDGQSTVDEIRLKNLAGFQIKILKHALRSFPEVKRVVYSTCSLHPQENEEVVKEVIKSSQRFKLTPVSELLKAPWNNFGSESYGEIGHYCLYAKPEEDLTNGFFVAVFDKLEEGEENPMFNSSWNNFVRHRMRPSNSQQNNPEESKELETNTDEYTIADDGSNLEKQTDMEVEVLSKKSKKKKHKHKYDGTKEEDEELCANDQSENKIDDVDSHNKKKKKKHKESQEANSIEVPPEVNYSSIVSSSTEKKIKNKKQTLEEVTKSDEAEHAECDSQSRKKSKKKKHKIETAHEDNMNQDLEEPVRKKKKCKKSHSENVVQDITNENDGLENTELTSYKKKSKKKTKKIDLD